MPPVRSIAIGSGTDLAVAREVLADRSHSVADAASLADAVDALVCGPTPDLVVVAADGAAAAAEVIASVRSHVRGEAAPLLALVPQAAVEAALDAGASLALPVPAERALVAGMIASAERAAWRARSLTAEQAAHDLYFTRNPHPMWFYDVDTLAFVAVNDAAVQKYGYSREELLAMTIKDIRPPEDVPRLLRATSRVESGLERSSGWRHRAKDGRIFHVEIISYSVRYAGRACELVLAHDVSERVEAERKLEELRAQLALSERLASIGTLAAGVAHEINTPLAYVLANLAFARERLPALDDARLPDGPALAESLSEALDGAKRVAAIVRDLQTFSRSEEQAIRPVDLGSVASSALSLAANELKHRARAIVDLGGLPPVLATEARLGQVLLNLVINAAHAIPEGDVASNEVRIGGWRDGEAIVVEVSDTGSGIPPEIRDRIWDPFFTTKPVGQGTGLGLWVCRRIVTALGGTIELAPSTGRGATIRMRLPAGDGPAADGGPSAPTSRSRA